MGFCERVNVCTERWCCAEVPAGGHRALVREQCPHPGTGAALRAHSGQVEDPLPPPHQRSLTHSLPIDTALTTVRPSVDSASLTKSSCQDIVKTSWRL